MELLLCGGTYRCHSYSLKSEEIPSCCFSSSSHSNIPDQVSDSSVKLLLSESQSRDTALPANIKKKKIFKGENYYNLRGTETFKKQDSELNGWNIAFLQKESVCGTT